MMKYFFINILIILLLQTNVMSQETCGERNVIGAVGGAVTLPVGHTGVTSFSWSFGETGSIITTTRPRGPIEIIDDQYDGRLSSTSNGSLIISKLRQEDQGTYRTEFRATSKQTCSYHLTVFSNLTAEDITISSNETENRTCEVTLTCSVNSVDKRNVSVTWRSVNRSDIAVKQNVVFVPPSNINFIYICTAENPVSIASKAVHLQGNCTNVEASQNITLRIVVIGAAVSLVLVIGGAAAKRIKSKSNYGNMKTSLTQEANAYEMRDEDCTVYCEALGDKEQNPQGARKKNNVNGQQEPAMCVATTVYSEIHHPQTTEPKESQSKENGNTLYSTVQHVKNKKGQKALPNAPNGNVSNASLESCYAQVQLPMHAKPAKDNETVYDKVQGPGVKNPTSEPLYEKV